jgi:hypothetical protein
VLTGLEVKIEGPLPHKDKGEKIMRTLNITMIMVLLLAASFGLSGVQANTVVCFGVRDSTSFANKIGSKRLCEVAREFFSSGRSVASAAGVVASFQFLDPKGSRSAS